MDLLVLREAAHGFEGHAIAGREVCPCRPTLQLRLGEVGLAEFSSRATRSSEVREQLYDFSARYGIGLDKSNTKWTPDPGAPWKQRFTVDVQHEFLNNFD